MGQGRYRIDGEWALGMAYAINTWVPRQRKHRNAKALGAWECKCSEDMGMPKPWEHENSNQGSTEMQKQGKWDC